MAPTEMRLRSQTKSQQAIATPQSSQQSSESSEMGDSVENTHANQPRVVTWLFFNPANEEGEVEHITVGGNTISHPVSTFGWAAELRHHYRFRARKVHFWRPKKPALLHEMKENWVRTVGDLKEVAEMCHPATPLKYVLGESWLPEYLHFLITADKFERDDDPEMVAERRETMSESPLQIMIRRHNEAIEANRLAPSRAARSKEYATLQGKPETVIYNGSFVCNHRGRPNIVTVAPPIQIFHPVFQEFLQCIHDPGFKPDESAVEYALKLMFLCSAIHPSEDAALPQLRTLLGKLLGGCVVQKMSTNLCTPDGIMTIERGDLQIPLFLLEYKRSIGEGGCDPSVQAAYSLQNFLYELDGLLQASCCPSFLLAGAGPLLSIYGVVQTDKLIVQHLADIHLRDATTYGDDQAYRIAKFFFSLRRARETLVEYYQGINLPTQVEDPIPSSEAEDIALPCFFPHPTKFKEHQATTPIELKEPHATEHTKSKVTEFTEFKYINVPDADPTNVTFFAEVVEHKPRRKLVIKFVDRYGTEAHETLAEKGMAPQLLYYGALDGEEDLRNSTKEGAFEHGLYIGPLRMVIMEYIKGEPWPRDAREQVKKAIDLLHEKELVFGDLRRQNVLFSGGKVLLIDFDWAGKEKEVPYPRGLSTRVRWADKPKRLERKLIKREHDNVMLELLFPPARR